MVRLLLALFVGILFVMSASGQTIQSSGVGTGNWNDAASWTPNTVPTAANSTSIVINSGHTINYDAAVTGGVDQVTVSGILGINSGITMTLANGTGNEITVNSGGTLTVTGILAFGGIPVKTVLVNGSLNNSGSLTGVTAAKLTFGSGSNYFHQFADGGTIPAATWNANSTVNIVGYTSGNSTPPSGLSQSFGHFVWNAPGQDVTISLGGLPTTVNGNFSVVDTGADALFYSAGGAGNTINIGGNFNVSGGVLGWTSGDAASSTINISGSVNISGGYVQFADDQNLTINLTGNFTLSGSGQIDLSASTAITNVNIQGNYTYSGGDLFIGGGTGNINFTGASTKTFTSTLVPSGPVNYSVATLSTLVVSGSNFVGGDGNFTLNGTLQLGSTDSGGALQTGTAAGNIRVAGTRTYATNSSIIYNGSGPQFIGNGFPSGGDVNLTINNSSGVTLSSSLDIVALRVLTLTSGNITIGAQTLTINGTVAGSGGIVGGATSNLVIGGTGNFGTLTFNGTNQLFNFTLNRTSSGLVTLGGSLTILGTFTHTAGTLDIGSNTLTISGAYGPANPDDLSVTSSSTLIVNGTGTLPSDVGFIGTTLGTLTLNRSGATFPTTSSIEITNLNLTSGIFSDGSGVAISPGGTITRSSGSIASNPSNTTNTYNVVYTSGTISTGPELPGNTTALANLSKTGTGTLTLAGAVTVNGTLTLSSGSFNAGSNAINLKGNFVSSAASTLTSSSITFSGTTILSGSTSPVFGAITISGSLTPSSSFQVNGNLVNNGTLNAGSATTTFGGNTTISGSSATSLNNVTISGTLVAPASTALNIAGNFVNNGTFNHNNGSVTFNGATTISGSAASNFFGVTISGTLNAPSSTTLGFAGNLVNNGTFNNNSGTVAFNGTVLAQSITGSSTLILNNVTVSNPVSPGVSVNSTVRLNGIFTLGSGGIFDADGSGSGVFIVSSSSQTAGGMINTLSTPANFSGNVRVERYIHGKTGGDYRYMSMPITNGFLSLWRNSIFVTGTFSDHNTNADNANITNSGNTNPSVFSYNSTTQAYVGLTGPAATTTIPLSNTVGYSAYDFNDGAVTATYIGTIGKGSISVPISNTTNNFNLVPNPYPAPIDWDNVTKTNVNNAMYIRVDKASVFSSYVNGIVTNAPFVGWTGEVAVGQSFFVSSSGSGNSLGFKEGDKTTNGFYFLRKETPDNYFRVTLASAATDQQDETVIHFVKNATDGMDSEFDAVKLKNGDPLSPKDGKADMHLNISSYLEGAAAEYSINTMDELVGPKIVKLNVSEVKPGKYSLHFSDLSMLSLGYKIILIDTYLNTETIVSDGDDYEFEVNAEAESAGTTRFSLRINGELVVTGLEPEWNGIKIYPNPVTDKIQIQLSTEEEKSLRSIELYDVRGITITNSSMDSNLLIPGLKTIDMRSNASGVYVLYIKYGDMVKSTRLIKK
jgi:hypothetical protein